jgi:hypothetical protein
MYKILFLDEKDFKKKNLSQKGRQRVNIVRVNKQK